MTNQSTNQSVDEKFEHDQALCDELTILLKNYVIEYLEKKLDIDSTEMGRALFISATALMRNSAFMIKVLMDDATAQKEIANFYASNFPQMLDDIDEQSDQIH